MGGASSTAGSGGSGSSGASGSSNSGASGSSNSGASSSGSGSGGSVASSTASSSSGSSVSGPAYYVSPGGSDANDGLSPAAPFQTLEKAQAAMRASASIKTTYLMGGTFARAAVLTLDAADSGEAWLAAPSSAPVLDGGGTTAEAFAVTGGSNITIRWLTLQSFASIGILGEGVSGLAIDSNTIQNIASTEFNQGGVVILGDAADVTITHNLVKKSNYAGIMAANSAGNTRSNLHIESNAVEDVCLSVADCGALHADDRSHSATGTVISHNVVGNYGPTGNMTKAIYLDDEESNVTVQYNIVYGTGEWALQIDGGDHDVFQNNIFDITGATQLGLYQDDGSAAPNYGMAGNVFSCNIVYSSSAPPSSLWQYTFMPIDTSQVGPLPNP